MDDNETDSIHLRLNCAKRVLRKGYEKCTKWVGSVKVTKLINGYREVQTVALVVTEVSVQLKKYS